MSGPFGSLELVPSVGGRGGVGAPWLAGDRAGEWRRWICGQPGAAEQARRRLGEALPYGSVARLRDAEVSRQLARRAEGDGLWPAARSHRFSHPFHLVAAARARAEVPDLDAEVPPEVGLRPGQTTAREQAPCTPPPASLRQASAEGAAFCECGDATWPATPPPGGLEREVGAAPAVQSETLRRAAIHGTPLCQTCRAPAR